MTNKKVIIWTPAYNAENTLRRTIDSVLGQTYTNFEYIVIDNASTDGTGDMIREYASKDSRVRLWRNERNVFGARLFADVIGKIRDMDCDFIAELDADDEYLPSFLKEMLMFADEYSLDIACCGYDFVDGVTNKLTGKRVLQKKLILDSGKALDNNLLLWYQFVRTHWAKLYSSRVMNGMNLKELEAVGIDNGSDTLFTLAAFEKASRIGISDTAMHRYYIYPKSAYRTFSSKRLISNYVLYEKARDFLIAKTGSVTLRNTEILLLVYMNAIQDTLNVLLPAEISESEKIAGAIDIFSHKYTKQLAAPENIGALYGDAPGQTKQRRELFAAAAQWLLTREEVPDEQIEVFCAAGEFVCAACENANGWLFFKKLLARFLLDAGRADEARPKLDELAEFLPGDAEVSAMRAEIK